MQDADLKSQARTLLCGPRHVSASERVQLQKIKGALDEIRAVRRLRRPIWHTALLLPSSDLMSGGAFRTAQAVGLTDPDMIIEKLLSHEATTTSLNESIADRQVP